MHQLGELGDVVLTKDDGRSKVVSNEARGAESLPSVRER